MTGAIGVVGYGMGNLRSVMNALERVGATFDLVEAPDQLTRYDKLLLPGVGAYGDCMAALGAAGFTSEVVDHVRVRGRPLLGICVGMQMLADEGTEFGKHPGLGLIHGRVVRIPRDPPDLRLPHVGWNALEIRNGCPLFAGLGADTACYFVHSYHFQAADPNHVAATVHYGGPVVAAVSAPPVYGVQFHPEKSQDVGLTILKNFSERVG